MEIKTSEFLQFVLDHGSDDDLARCFHRLKWELSQLDPEYLVKTEKGFQRYIQKLRETNNQGIYPFDFNTDNPNSVLSTASPSYVLFKIHQAGGEIQTKS
jgi:hypothetical protein